MHQRYIPWRNIGSKQLIADLKWVLESPSLTHRSIPFIEGVQFDLEKSALSTEDRNWLDQVEKDPSDLLRFFDSDQHFILGKYFERLLLFYFSHSPHFELLKNGEQIIEGAKTLGEIDFIFRDLRNDKVIHLEVAVKYYLGYKNSSKMDLWIGPNGSDTLQKKLMKFDAQLSLSDQLKLSETGLEKCFLIKGYLFKHLNSDKWPVFTNGFEKGCTWVYLNEIKKILDVHQMYSIIPKRKWLSFFLDDEEWMTSQVFEVNIQEEVALIGKGIMILIRDPESSDLRKVMVLPDHWPKL